MRHLLATSLLAALLCAPLCAQAADGGDEGMTSAQGADDTEGAAPRRDGDYLVDSDGARYRVAFDPGLRLWLGAELGGDGHDEASTLSFALNAGLALRQRLDFGKGDDFVRWRLDHVLLDLSLEPSERAFDSLPSLDATLYRGSFLRHAASGSIVFPSEPPKRLPFPLDIGIQCDVARLRAQPAFTPRSEGMRLLVADALLTLDPWRALADGNSFEIGIGPRYDLDLARAESSDAFDVLHRVAPFTALMLHFRWQDADGLTVLDARADLVPQWLSSDAWDLSFETSLRLERVLLSLNDTPLSAVLQASYETQTPQGEARFHAWRATAGLRWSAPLSAGD